MTEISQEAVELPEGVETWDAELRGESLELVQSDTGQWMQVKDVPLIQAQVLAGVKEAVERLKPVQFGEFDGPWLDRDEVLATLNPNKGEADGHDFKLAETCPTCGKPVEGEGLRSAVADAVEKLAGPLGRAHVRAEKGSEQEAELAEVVEQIGAIREAVEPGITAAIDALNHAQGARPRGEGLMPDDQLKVPEAVLDAFLGARTAGKTTGMSLAAALAQHHKELLGDEAREAAETELEAAEPDSFTWHKTKVVLQAAIDSVMKGGDGD